MSAAQQSNVWDPGNKLLGSSESMIRVQEINSWGPRDQWLEPDEQTGGGKETNRTPGHQWLVPRNQWLECRKSIAGAQEIHG